MCVCVCVLSLYNNTLLIPLHYFSKLNNQLIPGTTSQCIQSTYTSVTDAYVYTYTYVRPMQAQSMFLKVEGVVFIPP